MRKISLNSVKSYLSRDEMREINGGGTCGAYLPNGQGNSVPVFEQPNGGATINQGGPDVFRGITQAEALALTQGITGARWCCSNCSTASWY